MTPTTAAASSETTSPGGSTTSTSASQATDPGNGGSDEVVLEGGSATFTVNGEATDFDFFVCAFGQEATEDDAVAFYAFGSGTDSADNAVKLVVYHWDSLAQDGLRDGLREVGFWTEDASGSLTSGWSVALDELIESDTEQIVIDGDHVAATATFRRRTPAGDTEEYAAGTLDATCSPNSVGSSG